MTNATRPLGLFVVGQQDDDTQTLAFALPLSVADEHHIERLMSSGDLIGRIHNGLKMVLIMRRDNHTPNEPKGAA